MRQLWTTGWMHNRVRMIVASFLVKDLLIPWQEGAALVLGHAGRCRPGEQHAGLAMDGRLRRRRRPVFPHLQPGQPGREVRPRRRLRPPLGAGTGPIADGVDSQALGGPRVRAGRRGRRAGGKLPEARALGAFELVKHQIR